MKTRNLDFKLSAVALAVVSAMTTMSARAEDDEAKALMTPVNFVDVQGLWVSQSSAKFGEYNGLNKSGGYINGDLGIYWGSAYSDNENGGTMRSQLTGTNLGLTNRSANLTVADQGNWLLGLNYDALQHNISDSYQTPYSGTLSGNSWKLNGFGLAANTQQLTPGQIGQFNNVDIYSLRQNTSFKANKTITQDWNAYFDYNHLDMSGAKLQSYSAAAIGGATGERPSILPMPTNSTTDTFTLGVNWAGERARFGASYFGSFYNDNYNSVAFNTLAGATVNQLMSTPVSNQFNQLNLSGGYDFQKTTKLIANLSYGKGTSSGNSTGYDAGMMLSPAANFNSNVINTHADIKLVDTSVKNLQLQALYRYDKRDNQSSSDIYNAYSISGSNPYNYPNTPLSYQKQFFQLQGIYKLDKMNSVGADYAYNSINRWCNNYAQLAVYYPSGTNCVTGTSNVSNGFNLFYKLRANEDLNFKVNYGYDNRNSNYDQSAIAAFSTANVNPGMVPGQAGADYLGFVPFFEAARTQQAVKATANWQATDVLGFQLGGKYAYDQYTNNVYGVQNGTAWSINFDTNVAYSNTGSFVGWVTYQSGTRNLTSYTSSGLTTWSNNLQDNATTFGLGLRENGLMNEKLAINADFIYSYATTNYNGTLNSTTLTTDCNVVGTCGSPGAISNSMQGFKLQGTYKIDKTQSVALQYQFQHLSASDYYYNGYQLGYTPTSVMPTNQTAPSYNVNVIMLMYRAQL